MPIITFNIWSVIILVGAAQGFFLSLYLLAKSENRIASKWLAFLLIVISIHLLEYAATISGLTLQYPALALITYPLLFCIGPFYHFYCRSLLEKKHRIEFKGVVHFIPAVFVLVIMLPFYSLGKEEKISMLQKLSAGDSLKIPVEQLVFMGAHVAQTFIYVLISYRFIRKKNVELQSCSSDNVAVRKLGWLKTFSLYFAIYLLLYFILVTALATINSYQIEIDYVLLFITSGSIYAIAYTAIKNPEILKSLPEPELLIPILASEKPEDAIKNVSKFQGLNEQLLEYMETNKPYLKGDLKISDLATLLSVPSYQLSQLINEEFRVNFYDFINRYRVEEAKKVLVEDTRNYKILAIGYEVGFNSKATFNRVFRKFTGVTPTEYRDSVLRLNENFTVSQA